MDRRDFLKEAAVGAAVLGLAAEQDLLAAAGPTVVVVHSAGAAASSGDARRQRIQKMLTAGIEKLSGQRGAAAWKKYVKPSDVVALKVNVLASRAATSPLLADAVARGVISAGVKPPNCWIFDRFERELTAAGYRVGTQPGGHRVLATDTAGYGYEATAVSSGSVSQRLSSIVAKHASVLVNLPVIKDHNIAGVTAALKNHYGCIHNPAALHGNHADPQIAEVNVIPALRRKQKLVISDALAVIYEGGPSFSPSYRFEQDCLLLATDPVAHDAVAWKMIEDIRAKKGLRPLARVGRNPGYLTSAASRALGVADLARINVVRVEVK
ncbi:MAG: DUF362 domain-containing protein [Fimbriimonadaceae bacterium]|nr:DUF362 domain-containing protein [Fimbriimonadaceae bacterium]